MLIGGWWPVDGHVGNRQQVCVRDLQSPALNRAPSFFLSIVSLFLVFLICDVMLYSCFSLRFVSTAKDE